MQRRYKVVDVFSDRPLLGNPVAVVLDAEGLDDGRMAAIARWTNLSETTFVLAPAAGADYRVRIFTPGRELPFAGHPTLGTAHAVLEAGRAKPTGGKLIQDCAVGPVEIAISDAGGGRRLALTLPPANVTPLDDDAVAELEAILGYSLSRALSPAIVDVGVVWAVAQVDSVDALLSLAPDYARSARFERRRGLTGLSVFAVDPASGDIETRSFAPSCGVNEDPVCGSGNGSVAVFRRRGGQLSATAWSYVAHQGGKVGRDGRVTLSGDGEGTIRVGGACVTTVDGTLDV